MKRGYDLSLFLINGMMELSWLYAWATFFIVSTLDQPLPLQEAIGPFALASALTLFSNERGWRVIQILGLHLLGGLLAALRMVYIFNRGSYSFWDKTWLIEFFNRPRPPQEWLWLFLLLFCAAMFWFGGIGLARRSMVYTTLCSRFDAGVAAFLLLFLIKFLLLIKGGMKIEQPISQLLFFQFFVLSLLGIGLARNRGAASKEFLPGYQSIGVILIFAGVVLLFGGGVVLFFLPYLKLAAEVTYGVLAVVAKPVGYVILQVLRFLYMPRANRPEEPSAERGLGDLKTPSGSGWLPEIVEKILGWGLGSLLGLAASGLCFLILFYLLRWLFSRTSVREKRQSRSLWHLISFWMLRFQTFLVLCWAGIKRELKGCHRAADFFAVLLRWGRHSGLSRLTSETPMEYGLRLKSQFPSLEREIGWIIEAFHHEVYGEIRLDRRQLAMARRAWHRLRSPLHWPSRLRAWFRQPGSPPGSSSAR
ncbi:MAG TPA: DUF4129 domain-containing protein [Thermodesulfobacteriota bacterium]|nr:DUF4129 domain-containing protein [Thermodesulfobacteriota bacterium]